MNDSMNELGYSGCKMSSGFQLALVCRDLVENIYSHEVFEEYMRRFSTNVTFGEAWSSGVIPEFFLGKVLGRDQRHSASLPLCACLPADLVCIS